MREWVVLDKQEGDVPNTEELSSGRTKCNVGTSEVMDRSLREHGVVFQLRLAERGAVAGNQDELGCRTKTCPRGEEHAENTSSAQGTFSASRSSPRRESRSEMVLTLAVAHVLERGLVAEAVLARLDDERKPRRDALGRLGGLGLLGGCHWYECEGKERRRRRRQVS